MFNRIMVENIQNYSDKMKQSVTQQPLYSQNQQIKGNNDNYGDGIRNDDECDDNDNDNNNINNSNLKFTNIFDVYKNMNKKNDENQQKIINISKIEKQIACKDIQNNENVQNGLENYNDSDDDDNDNDNDDDYDEQDGEEFLIQSKIQSRINRPEEERKMLEEVDKCQEILKKQISESQNNSQLREQQKKVCCRTYFVQGENLPLENEIIEYKNFQWPLQDDVYVIDKLQKLICGMLNSKGGTVLIGVHDNSFNVLGLNLSANQQEDYKLFIQNQVLDNDQMGIFDPKISIIDTQIRIQFIPVMNQQKQWLLGKWILKLQIKPNQSQLVYTLHNQKQQDALKCFVRLDGLNRKLSGIQLKQFMYDKSNQFHSKSFQNIHECFTEPYYYGVLGCTFYEQLQENQKINSFQNHKNMRNNNQQQVAYYYNKNKNNKRQQLKENYFVNPNESKKQQQNNKQNKNSNNDLQKTNNLQIMKNKNINQQSQKQNKVSQNIKDLQSKQKIIQTQENNTSENNQQIEGSKNKIQKAKKKDRLYSDLWQ
ncbi:hypothetical protein PPERSA_03444 [Pseudocohnilembus persalinus]|uniref:Schlafen AlbA-2 domain-containing protein n=1 Tax=Pseudocohnilembus persalinus TaxID=266149 RepID=A0A0V0QBY1_PSEPJ|nr:hypothetical protein PPERSA_03444 [Pseudocohnilembus persalinus]|eukprot:KRW99643.1 hypothetical protein PPERSA_03444 [Pseudocohnilembus persalinus]